MSSQDMNSELHEKAKGCQSREELEELAKEEDVELNDDMLEGLAGGYDDPRRPCPDKRDDPKDW